MIDRHAMIECVASLQVRNQELIMDVSQTVLAVEEREEGGGDRASRAKFEERVVESAVRDFLRPRGDAGMARIAIPMPSETSDEGTEPPWDRFLHDFDDDGLTFLYRNNAVDGRHGRFFRFFLK